jgi:predicted permease
MRPKHWLYTVPLRLRSLFRRQRVEQDLEEELQYHLERKTEEFVAQGLTPKEARWAALRAMDGLTQRKEECRDERRVNLIENLIQDIRYGLRVLGKSPGFTAVAVLTLALAIGSNAVVFGVLNALILRPLNVPQPESLYGVEHGNEHSMYASYPDYLDLRDRNRSFEGLAAYNISQVGMDTGENPSRAWVVEGSGNYFDVLGIKPYFGRVFHAADEHGPNSAPYIVLSHAYWRIHFNEDKRVVGRVVRLNKHPYTIIGIAPPEFHGTLLFFSPDFYVPLVQQEQIEGKNTLSNRASAGIFVGAMGHLKAGVTPEQAVADLNSVGSYLEKTYPIEHGATTFRLARPGLYGNYLGGPMRAFLAGLMLLAGLILVAACANLGSLFAARAADRAREVALRLALGATRNRILRQFLTEAVLISIAGGAIGLWGCIVLLHGLTMWHPLPRFPINVPVTPDGSVYAMAVALALVSGLLFGIFPIRQILRTNPYQVVKAGPSGTVGRRITMRDLLLATQIAICAVLVTSSMVALRGLVRSLNGNYGFEPRNTMLIDTDLNMAGYTGDDVATMQRRMIDAVEAVPGVKSVGLIQRPPLAEGSFSALVFTDQTADLRPSNAVGGAVRYQISPRYFDAAGTALLAGRALSWHDDQGSPKVAVVNREFARKFFGSPSDALGGHFKLRNGTRVQVVGIVEDGKYLNLVEDPQMAVFLPVLQSPTSETWLVVRANRDPEQLAPAIRATLRGLDSGLPVYMQTRSQHMDSALFPIRIATLALGVMGGMGAVLAITGIFGMAAYSVSKRMKELGIRIALGAQRKEVLRAALGRAFKLLAIGSAAGLALGVLATRVLAFIVYQATPRDPLVLFGAVAAMLLLGLLATWIPARRAMGVDPLTLLREE